MAILSISRSLWTTASFGYDAAGNIAQDSSRSYLYDGEVRLKEIRSRGDNTRISSYRYDPFGRRVKREARSDLNYMTKDCLSQQQVRAYASEVVIYIYGAGGELLAEYLTRKEPKAIFDEAGNHVCSQIDGLVWSQRSRNIQMEGVMVARWTTGADRDGQQVNRIAWLHRNHLGEAKVTDTLDLNLRWGDWASCSDPKYWSAPPPWELPCTRTEIRSYTSPYDGGGSDQFQGHKADEEAGLKYMVGRYYNPAIGRFMTPDSYLGASTLEFPQTWNKYSYVLNDPLSYVDPNGLNCTTPDGRSVPCPNETDVTVVAVIGQFALGGGGQRGNSHPPMLSEAFAEGRSGGGIDELARLVFIETITRIAQLKLYLEDPDRGCTKFFGNLNGKNIIDDLKKTADSLSLYNVDILSIGALTLSHFFPGVQPNPTLVNYLGKARAAVIIAQRVLPDGTREIVWSNNIAIRNNADVASLLHETLHIFFKEQDIKLADRLGLGQFTDADKASESISGFLRNDCKK